MLSAYQTEKEFVVEKIKNTASWKYLLQDLTGNVQKGFSYKHELRKN